MGRRDRTRGGPFPGGGRHIVRCAGRGEVVESVTPPLAVLQASSSAAGRSPAHQRTPSRDPGRRNLRRPHAECVCTSESAAARFMQGELLWQRRSERNQGVVGRFPLLQFRAIRVSRRARITVSKRREPTCQLQRLQRDGPTESGQCFRPSTGQSLPSWARRSSHSSCRCPSGSSSTARLGSSWACGCRPSILSEPSSSSERMTHHE